MNVLERILQLRIERGWSEYRLSEEAGIAQTTISSWFRKKIYPSIPSLEKICCAFNITMSQFFNFDKKDLVDLTSEQADLLDQWDKLSKEQQVALLNFLHKL